MRNNIKRSLSFALLGLVIFAAVAGSPAGGAEAFPGEPQRSYAAIDVILYQTGW
jgi:hypothetical protein